MKRILIAGLLLCFTSAIHAEGWLSVSPGYDAINGRGNELSLEIDQPIKEKLSLTSCATFSRFETYRDVIGSIGLEFEVSKRLIIGAGYSYDRFSMLDTEEAPFESKNVYSRIKYRLW